MQYILLYIATCYIIAIGGLLFYLTKQVIFRHRLNKGLFEDRLIKNNKTKEQVVQEYDIEIVNRILYMSLIHPIYLMVKLPIVILGFILQAIYTPLEIMDCKLDDMSNDIDKTSVYVADVIMVK